MNGKLVSILSFAAVFAVLGGLLVAVSQWQS